ncbi:hypothetical protein ACLI4R_17435 [Natrialbaceae archaeon A-chndr2]
MEEPDEIPRADWLRARFKRREVERGTTDSSDRYYEDDQGRRHPSTTTIVDRIDFGAYPEDHSLHENPWPLRMWKRQTDRWWVQRWYKRQVGILAHHLVTSQMDVSTPDDTIEAKTELIEPTDDAIRGHSKRELYETVRDYDDVALRADEWTYDRYPADHPLLDVAERDALDIAHLWRTEVRPELGLEYGDVYRGELKFVRLLDGEEWPPLGYGGQIDLIADLRGKVRALDIKTGALRTPHRMQATAYQHAFPELEGAVLVSVSPTGEWDVEWSEEWPQETLWQQFRAEIVTADMDDTFNF